MRQLQKNKSVDTAHKIYAKIQNKILTAVTENIIEEEQKGFGKGRSTMDAVFVIEQFIEKRREYNQETCLAFVDFEKPFDSINNKCCGR